MKFKQELDSLLLYYVNVLHRRSGVNVRIHRTALAKANERSSGIKAVAFHHLVFRFVNINSLCCNYCAANKL